MRVDVEPGMRIAADVTWEAAAKYHCLSWRYLCSIEGVAEALAAAVAIHAAATPGAIAIHAAATPSIEQR